MLASLSSKMASRTLHLHLLLLIPLITNVFGESCTLNDTKPYEGSCVFFQHCDADGHYQTAQCPEKMLYDSSTGFCDWSQNVNCSESKEVKISKDNEEDESGYDHENEEAITKNTSSNVSKDHAQDLNAQELEETSDPSFADRKPTFIPYFENHKLDEHFDLPKIKIENKMHNKSESEESDKYGHENTSNNNNYGLESGEVHSKYLEHSNTSETEFKYYPVVEVYPMIMNNSDYQLGYSYGYNVEHVEEKSSGDGVGPEGKEDLKTDKEDMPEVTEEHTVMEDQDSAADL